MCVLICLQKRLRDLGYELRYFIQKKTNMFGSFEYNKNINANIYIYISVAGWKITLSWKSRIEEFG